MGGLKLGKEAQAKFDEARTNPDKAGYLDKKGAKRKNWNNRWFVLKDNYLFYCKNEKSLPQGIINLHGCTVCKLEGPNTRSYSFSLLAPKSVSVDAKWTNRTYLMAAKNDDQWKIWVDILETSGRKSVERAAAAKANNSSLTSSQSGGGFGAEPANKNGESDDEKPTKKGDKDAESSDDDSDEAPAAASSPSTAAQSSSTSTSTSTAQTSEEIAPLPIQKIDGPLPIKREVDSRPPRKKEESSDEEDSRDE